MRHGGPMRVARLQACRFSASPQASSPFPTPMLTLLTVRGALPSWRLLVAAPLLLVLPPSLLSASQGGAWLLPHVRISAEVSSKHARP